MEGAPNRSKKSLVYHVGACYTFPCGGMTGEINFLLHDKQNGVTDVFEIPTQFLTLGP